MLNLPAGYNDSLTVEPKFTYVKQITGTGVTDGVGVNDGVTETVGVNDGVTEGDSPGVTLTLGVGVGVVVFVAKSPYCTAPKGI